MKKLIVQKQSLIHNIEKLKAHAAQTGTTLIAMLKGNGYGLGISQFAAVLLEQGITHLAVSELVEAVQLREAGIGAQIMLLSPLCSMEEAKTAVSLDIICAIGSPDSATILELAAREVGMQAKAQLVIDTGFGRFGFLAQDMTYAIKAIEDLAHVDIVGTFSHLSNSFGKRDTFSYQQYRLFLQAVQKLEDAGIDAGMRHICNSCGFLRYPDMHLDAVRVGSAFLGRLPIADKLGLEKIAYLESAVCEVKQLPKGHNIGYANTYRTKSVTKIAVIPIGYKDGFGVAKVNDAYRFLDILRYVFHDMLLFFKDNHMYVEIEGKRCRLLGRISMFNVIADITGMDVAVGASVRAQCNPILIDSHVERVYV